MRAERAGGHDLQVRRQQGTEARPTERPQETVAGDPQSPGGTNVAFVLDDEHENHLEASQIASVVIRVRSKEEFADKLAALQVPLGRLSIHSHGTSVGAVKLVEGAVFFKDGQTSTRVTLDELADAVRKKLPQGLASPPATIEFRGCRIGGATDSLEAFRSALGADRATATNCKTVVSIYGPFVMRREAPDGSTTEAEIRKPSDLKTPEEKAFFDQEFPKDIATFPPHDCIAGLGGAKAADATTRLKKLYFANNGELVATYVNPCPSIVLSSCDAFSPPITKCFEKLPTEGKCRRVEVRKPGKGGKSACFTPPGGDIVLTSAGASALVPADTAADRGSELVGLARGDGLVFGTEELRPRVESLQERLNSRAGADLAVDGMFGEATAQALRRFQLASGLPPAPEVDQATAAVLAGAQPVAGSDLVGLQRGDGLVWGTWGRRPRVSKLQTLLNGHGMSCAIDGMYGPETEASVAAFQSSRGLPIDDEIDRHTADALEGRTPPPSICLVLPSPQQTV